MTKELVIQASVLDGTHLELDEPLPDDLGQHLKVHIRLSQPEQEKTLREERIAYQTQTLPETSANVVLDVKQAIITANRFIVENLPDRFSAGLPKPVTFPIQQLWLVPILLTYPGTGVVGEVGMVAIARDRPVIVGYTPVEEMEALAHQLYEENCNEIELAFS